MSFGGEDASAQSFQNPMQQMLQAMLMPMVSGMMGWAQNSPGSMQYNPYTQGQTGGQNYSPNYNYGGGNGNYGQWNNPAAGGGAGSGSYGNDPIKSGYIDASGQYHATTSNSLYKQGGYDETYDSGTGTDYAGGYGNTNDNRDETYDSGTGTDYAGGYGNIQTSDNQSDGNSFWDTMKGIFNYGGYIDESQKPPDQGTQEGGSGSDPAPYFTDSQFGQIKDMWGNMTNANPNFYNILPGPTAPNMPSAKGMYTGIQQPGIPSYDTNQSWNVPNWQSGSYNVGQGWDTQSYNLPGESGASQAWQSQGWQPQGYNVPGQWQAPGANLPGIGGLLPVNMEQSLGPDIMQAIKQPYQDQANQLMEQMNSQGQAGTAGAGMTGAAGKALGQYWTERGMPAVQRDAYNMLQPAMLQNYQTQANEATRMANLGAGGAEQQWSANLGLNQTVSGQQYESNRYQAMQGTGANEWLAKEQAARGKFDALSTTERDKWLANSGLDKGKFDALSTEQQNQWVANQTVQRDTWKANNNLEKAKSDAEKKWGLNTDLYNKAVQEATLDYQNETDRINKDYGMNAAMWGEGMTQQKMPWNMMSGLMGQAQPTTAIDPGTQGFNVMSMLPFLAMK